MTCIVGIADGETVWMGGDSCGSNGYSTTPSKHSKVFIRETHGERFVIGYTGSFRTGQVLEYKLDVPRNEGGKDAYCFMVETVVDKLRTLLKDQGCIKSTESQDRIDGTFLIGYRGGLFKVQSDYSALESTRGYAAVGSGGEVAMGALFVAHGGEPEAAITKALEAAAEMVPSVAGPFHVVTLAAQEASQ